MAHSFTQNAIFDYRCDEDTEHPPGRSIIDRIDEGFRRIENLNVSVKETWRDAGWHIIVESNDASFEVIVSPALRDEFSWMLQVACRSDVGPLRQWLGGSFVDQSDVVYEISLAVADQISQMGASNMSWKIDGIPDRKGGSDTPLNPKAKK